MALQGANDKLVELAAIARQNRSAFEFFLAHIRDCGFSSLFDFVTSKDEILAMAAIECFLDSGMSEAAALLDGMGRPYKPKQGAWLLVAWVLRDSPQQRLSPMLASCKTEHGASSRATILNRSRASAAAAFPDPVFWEWPNIMMSMIRNLEGSRRALKGLAAEDMVREALSAVLTELGLDILPAPAATTIDGESHDIALEGPGGCLLFSVKTRETGGGGHAHIFSRDVASAARKARDGGAHCIPVIVSRNWTADISRMECHDVIHIPLDPAEGAPVSESLMNAFRIRAELFLRIAKEPRSVGDSRNSAVSQFEFAGPFRMPSSL